MKNFDIFLRILFFMKKILLLFLFVVVLVLIVCGKFGEFLQKLVVVVMVVLYVEIFEVVKLIFKQEGVDLDVCVFNDYVQFNDQLVQKQVDVNYFQIELYLDVYNCDCKIDLVKVIGVYIELFGVYLCKVKLLVELCDGVDVVILNDLSNNSCVLILLYKVGVIELKDLVNVLLIQCDIIVNLKNLKFCELDLVMLLCVLDQVDLVLININYVLDVGFNLIKDVLVIESKDLLYVNFLVVCLDNKDDVCVQKLVKVLISLQVKVFIEIKYKGVVLLVF